MQMVKPINQELTISISRESVIKCEYAEDLIKQDDHQDGCHNALLNMKKKAVNQEPLLQWSLLCL